MLSQEMGERKEKLTKHDPGLGLAGRADLKEQRAKDIPFEPLHP